jgi:hypothetical protein
MGRIVPHFTLTAPKFGPPRYTPSKKGKGPDSSHNSTDHHNIPRSHHQSKGKTHHTSPNPAPHRKPQFIVIVQSPTVLNPLPPFAPHK